MFSDMFSRPSTIWLTRDASQFATPSVRRTETIATRRFQTVMLPPPIGMTVVSRYWMMSVRMPKNCSTAITQKVIVTMRRTPGVIMRSPMPP